MTARLAGKVAVVTGGASGIGEATVRRFCAEGARVVIADLNHERGATLAAELGADALFVRCDVTVESDIGAAVDAAVLEYDRLDIMFNNAGAVGAVGPIASLEVDRFDQTVAILFRGVALGMKHAARVMVPNRSGTIVSTASVGAVAGGLGAHIYSACKAAVLGLTRSVSAELWPHGIRVNAVVPGKIATPMIAELRQARGADPNIDTTKRIDDRMGVPDDIAAAVTFLASDDASFINGEELFVDAGLARSGWPAAMVDGSFTAGAMLLPSPEPG